MLRNLGFCSFYRRCWNIPIFARCPTENQNYSIGGHNELSVNDDGVRKYLQSLKQEFYNLRSDPHVSSSTAKRIKVLSPVVGKFEERECLLKNISSLKDIKDEKDEDMQNLVKEEQEIYTGMLEIIEKDLMEKILYMDDNESYSSMIFEISAGVGGQEAMLFARELFEMYCNFVEFKGWEYEIIQSDHTDVGGMRHASIIVYGDNAYKILRYEGGVHRVQRIPATEKSGRIHTSTVSVAAIPRPDNIETVIKEKDLKIETKRASGAGGQHVNTTDSAVRIVHIPTGITVECQTDRSQKKNRDTALKKLQNKLCQQQMDEQEATTHATRKAQVGMSFRNEKVRTYNFPQDRLTDHRIKGGTTHNLEEFLKGSTSLETLIKQLEYTKRRDQLQEIINNLCKENI